MKKLILLFGFLIPSCALADTAGITRFVSVTPTVTASSAYAANNEIGGLMTFTNACRKESGTGYAISVSISDKAAQATDMYLVLFSQSLSGSTTLADKTAFTPADSDLNKIAAVVTLGSSSRYSWADNGTKYSGSLTIPITCKDSSGRPQGDLYGVLVSGGTPTFQSTSDLTVTLAINQD